MDPSVKHVWMLAAARPISRFAQDCISLLLPPFPIHFCLLLVEVNEPGVFRIAKYYGSVLFSFIFVFFRSRLLAVVMRHFSRRRRVRWWVAHLEGRNRPKNQSQDFIPSPFLAPRKIGSRS